MPAKPLNEQSTESLLKQEKTLKLSITISMVAAGLMLIAGLWLTFAKHKFSALTVIPLSMGIIAITNVQSLKAIRNELKTKPSATN